jgi:hypothetical protein
MESNMNTQVAKVSFDNLSITKTPKKLTVNFTDNVAVILNDQGVVVEKEGCPCPLEEQKKLGLYIDAKDGLQGEVGILRAPNASDRDNESVTIFSDNNVLVTVYANDTQQSWNKLAYKNG